MPELPEVETITRQLAPHLSGRRIEGITVHHPDLLREPPSSFLQALQGTSIESVTRRGKNIVLDLTPPGFLVVNLGMTGQLLFNPPGSENEAGESKGPSHPGVDFALSPSGLLLYADTRRFGSLRRFTAPGWDAESARLGPEPLDPGLHGDAFHELLRGSRSPIRSWLLDQSKIAGIGNIYAAEALFRAGIHPRRPARSMDGRDAARLLQVIREVLTEAIRARGTTLRDYRTASGDLGSFGPSLQVYGREGEPCMKCKTPLRRIVFGNRSSFFCPRCQPEE